MKQLRCLIADDEPIARKILETYIEDIPNLELASSCKNAFEVLEYLQKEKVDLLFLDINMPKFSGISLIKSLSHKPAIIITTAYPEYAVEGFELAVTDYLLKPFSLERFLQAILKVSKPEKSNPVLETQKTEPNDSIFVKSDKKLVKLRFNEIHHIEAYGNYVKIHAEKLLLTSQSLTEFLERLPENFVRIHKSYVINFDKIELFDGNQVVLQNEAKLVIGKSYRKDFMHRIEDNC